MNKVAAVVPWSIGRWNLCRHWSSSSFAGPACAVIQRDPRGDAPLLLDVVDGVAYDADRHPTSTGGLQREDIKLLPQVLSQRSYPNHRARSDAGSCHTRTARHKQKKSEQQAAQEIGDKLLGDGAMPKIETIDANSARPLFKDVIPHIVQDSIDAEIISQEEGS